MNEHALKLIDDAFETKSTFLDLGNCSLITIPNEILKLKGFLEHLNLGSWYKIDRKTVITSNEFSVNFFSGHQAHLDNLLELSKLKLLSVANCSIDLSGIAIISQISTLTSLNISFNEISEKGAAHVSKLTSLTSLDIRANEIKDIGAAYVSQLSSLTHLDISSNKISYTGAAYITNLSSLKSLEIGSNKISDNGAAYVSQLSSLTSLSIGYNGISEKGAAHISQLSSLTSLEINSNKIGDNGAAYVSQLPSLISLNIGSTEISDEGAAHIGKLSSLTHLDISYNEIKDTGAAYVSQLSSLTSLSIGYNGISEKGAAHISQLSSLTSLEINSNKIGDNGAAYVSQLPSLISLNIGSTEISDEGAAHIGKLSSLTHLNISYNEIKDTGAAHISQLSSLTYLNICSNEIKDIDSNRLGKLKNLETLNLRDNLIEIISLNLIKSINLEVDIEQKDFLYGKLFLGGNPINNPPPEVLKQGRTSILEYLEEILRPLNECKLIFVGDGSVGKTSLMKRLVYKTFDVNERTTHGINKIAWKEILNEQNEVIKVNLWDFGGQHIQHSLHQFFFTERVVYVLVLNPRNDEKAHYWLDQIDKLGQDSQCLIVYNWKDEKDKEANYLGNFYELRKTYPKLPEPILLSCATGEGMDEFLYSIKRAICANDGLKTKYPILWFEIKEKLEKEISIQKNYIEYPKYVRLCEEKNYNDKERRKNLLKILDSVGSIVFFDKPILNQLQVLNPEWITTGAYAILTSEKTKDTKGHLKWDDLIEIFEDEKEIFSDKNIKIKYSEQHFQFILQLMLDYQLCQKSPLGEHEYLIPSAFGEKPQRDYQFEKVGSRHYRLQFESPFEMLIIHRFIAKNIIHIVSKDYWNSGIFFKHATSETYALVETNLYSKQINCWIKGDNIRGHWEVIRSDFREIFKLYHNFPVKEEVLYVSDGQEVFLPYQEMLSSLKNGITTIAYHPTYELKDIDVQNVLELFESPEQTKRIMNNEGTRVGPNTQINVNPQITVNPQISVNPHISGNSEINSPPNLAKDHIKPLDSIDFKEENHKVKAWKALAIWIFGIGLFITILIVLAYDKEWFLSQQVWLSLKKTDLLKWGGLITAFVWNGFIGKILYDRCFDETKEKAYRDYLRQKPTK